MKRLRRWIFNGIIVLSLLMCVASAALWILTAGPDDFQTPYHLKIGPLHLRAASGQVEFASLSGGSSWLFYLAPADASDEITPARLCEHHAMGFGWDTGRSVHGGRPRVILPDWFLCILAMTPTAWWALRRPSGALRSGSCPTCGYDLRATPDRCPECGTIPNRLA